jgi:Transposase, Mutator family
VSHIEILIASFAAAQNLGEISVDARRLEGGSGFAQKERDGLRGLVRRLRDFLGVGVSKFADGRAGVREDGQKVLLAIKQMGGESTEAWRTVLDDLVKRGLRRSELLIVDGGAGLESAIAAVWDNVPVQRCAACGGPFAAYLVERLARTR